MRKDKEQAFALRMAGKSYLEIEKVLGISRGTLSFWFKGRTELSGVLQEGIERAKKTNRERVIRMNEARRKVLDSRYKEAQIIAKEEFAELTKNPLFLVGLALYWGEGDKRSLHNIRISNVDPEVIKIFIRFSKNILHIPQGRIKIGLLLYPDLDANICREYWEERLELSADNFYKSCYIQGRHKVNRLSYGVCSAGYSDIYLKKKILVWLEMLGEFIINTRA